MFVGNVEPKTEMEDINIDAKINLGFNSFFFFFFFLLCFVFCVLVGPRIGPNPLIGPTGPWEENLLSKRAGSGPQVLARGSGPSMEKPGLNLTHCRS